MHFSDNELTILSIIDLIIVYLFCILQVSYNILTIKYILKSKNKINRTQLWRAYLFAFAPIVYSILPILLILYLYIPSTGTYNINYPGLDFALKLIYIHLAPICLVFLIIFIWNIICTIHNKKYHDFNNLLNSQKTQYFINEIKNYVNNNNNVFKKGIYKWFLKMQKNIEIAINNVDFKSLMKLLSKIEGWYIAKQRFQFFWFVKNKYEWIKTYYYQHYISLLDVLKTGLKQLILNNEQ